MNTTASTTTRSTITWEDLGFRESSLAKNLSALERSRPDLCEALRDATVHDLLSVRQDDDGGLRVFVTFRRQRLRVEERPAEVTTDAAVIDGDATGRDSLLVGAGTGERAARLLAALPAGETLWVFERDPALLTLTLSRRDWSDAILRGRVRFLLGSDLRHFALPRLKHAVIHPLLADILSADVKWVREHLAIDAVGLDHAPRQERVIVMAGELLHFELARALEALGHDVSSLDPATVSRDGIRREIERLAPAGVFSINFTPEMGEICGALGVPYVSWEIDPCVSTIPAVDPRSPAAAETWIFTWRRSRVDVFRRAGYRHVSWLPLAADTKRRQPTPVDPTLAGRPVFIGSCMRRQGQKLLDTLRRGVAGDRARAGSWNAVLLELQRLDRMVRSDPCRLDIEAAVQELLRDNGLPCRTMIEGKEADVVMLLGESLAATKRITLARTLIDEGLVVFGEEDWRAELPEGAYRGALGHGEPLNRAYSSAGITLDVNRVYQPDIVTLRVFDALACGGFVLAEANDDLRDTFAIGSEIETFASVSELREKVRHYRARPAEARAIAERGRARVQRDHAVAGRVERMLVDACPQLLVAD